MPKDNLIRARETNRDGKLRFVTNQRDLDTGDYSIEISFSTIDGRSVKTSVSRGMIGEWEDIGRILQKRGADLPHEAKKLKPQIENAYAKFESQPQKEQLLTRRCGFHGTDFVLVDQTIGPRSDRLFFVDPGASAGKGKQTRGHLTEWRKGLREPCKMSTYLTFLVATPFAGPVLSLLDEDEGALFHCVGESSTGKTLGIRAAASALGRARRRDLATFDMTGRALEEACYAANDLALFIDEYARFEGSPQKRRTHANKFAFMVPSGKGAVRSAFATRNAELHNLTWRTLGLSSAEVFLENDPSVSPKGAILRLIQIPDPGLKKRNGIFDGLTHGDEGAGEKANQLAAAVGRTIKSNYGLPIRGYLEKFVADRKELRTEARQIVEEFITGAQFVDTSWDRRFARKFGIVLAGAIFASRYNISPWSEQRARESIRNVYRRARVRAFDKLEAVHFLAWRLNTLFQQGKLPEVEKGDAFPNGALGISRSIDGHNCLAVTRDRIGRILGSTGPVEHPLVDQVIGEFRSCGVLLPGADSKATHQIQVKGLNAQNRARFVCLRRDKLAGLLKMPRKEWFRPKAPS